LKTLVCGLKIMFAVSFAKNVVLRPLLFAENVVSKSPWKAVLSLDVCSSLQLGRQAPGYKAAAKALTRFIALLRQA
jgi:hypothetical protein